MSFVYMLPHISTKHKTQYEAYMRRKQLDWVNEVHASYVFFFLRENLSRKKKVEKELKKCWWNIWGTCKQGILQLVVVMKYSATKSAHLIELNSRNHTTSSAQWIFNHYINVSGILLVWCNSHAPNYCLPFTDG